MGQYTKEMDQAYRKERDQKAAELKEENRARMESEAAPRVWLADGGRETDFQRKWPKLRDKGRPPAPRRGRRPSRPRRDASPRPEPHLDEEVGMVATSHMNKRLD